MHFDEEQSITVYINVRTGKARLQRPEGWVRMRIAAIDNL